jgi:hypothetical protein
MNKKNIVKTFLLFLIFSTIADSIYLLTIPSDPKNNILWGISAYRLLLLGFFFLVILAFSVLLFKTNQQTSTMVSILEYISKSPFWRTLLISLFSTSTILGWIVFFAPPYLFQSLYAFFVRLRPIILWTQTLLCSLTLLLIIIKNNWCLFIGNGTQKKRLKAFLLIVFIVFVLSLIIAGGYPKLTEDLWFGRYSVPILITQIIASWIIVTIGMQIYSEFKLKIPIFLSSNVDLIIFVLVWLCAIGLWTHQPIEFMQDMYFTTIEQNIEPLPPNYEIYPRKDSQTYFNVTESIVVGQGIYRSIDKPLFLAFEGLNNWLNDGDYEKMLNMQIIVLAFFPPIIYLLGKELHSRWAGLLGAALVVMQEINGIKIMDEFPVVSSKVLLTEPFMQLWNGLIALMLVIAFKNSKKNQGNLFFVCGGLLGLSALFRLNTLVISPFIMLIVLIKYFYDKKRLINNLCVFGIGIFLALSPWMVQNTIKYNDPLAFIKAKVEGVIVEKRYEKIIDQLIIKDELPGIKMASLSSEGFNSSIFTIPTNNSDEQSEVTKIVNLKSINNQEPSDNNNIIFFVNNIFNNRDIKQALNVQNILQLSSSILRHFLNNVITNFSILPTSVIPQDLFHGSRSQQFWGSYDPNLYEGINIFVVVTNLFIIATGIFAAINYQKFIGILPLVVGVGYNLSNAIAISSGNRYSQPTSWIVLFYYVLGLITISQWFLHLIRNQQPRKLGVHQSITRTFSFKTRRIYSTFSIVFILFIGSIPVMANIVPPVRFLEFSDEEIISAIFNNSDCKAALNATGYTDEDDFLEKLQEGNYYTSIGRILYPVQVNQEEYEIIYGKSEIKNDSTMMTFIFLSPENNYEQRMIFYPDDSLIGLKHRADVLIIGKGSEALLIGVIDSVYASKIVTYESLSNLPINCYMSANK